jgi:hypothetical protein
MKVLIKSSNFSSVPRYETCSECAIDTHYRDMMNADDRRVCWKCYHKIEPTPCKECGTEVPKNELIQTYDCQGIPYRRVCYRCNDAIGEYDGQYYDERDENLDYDY